MSARTAAAQAGHPIGEAARQSGVSAANIRYYEREGLLAPGPRSDNGYRRYSAADIHQLRFIRLCRAMDMSLDEVRTLLALDLRSRRDCALAQQALDEHLRHVRLRLAELRTLEQDLRRLRERCDGRGAHCQLIEALHARADALPAPPAVAGPRRHV